MVPERTRRDVLAAACLGATGGLAGCPGRPGPRTGPEPGAAPTPTRSATRSSSPTRTGSATPTPTPACGAGVVVAVNHVIEEAFPYDEWVRVDVTVTGDAPTFRGRVDTCDGELELSRDLEPGEHDFEFGPFGHHCVDDWEFWFEGCR